MSEDWSIRGRAIAYAKKHELKLKEGGLSIEAELLDTAPLLAAVEAHRQETTINWLPEPVKTCIATEKHLVEFDDETGECAACGYAESEEWNFTLDQQGPIAGTELPPDGQTGWSRTDVFVGDNGAGDECIGFSYNSGYRKGNDALDLIYFVTGHHLTYEVKLMAHSYKVDSEGNHVESADEEYEYSYPHDISYPEYERALRAARAAATGDERFKLG